MLQSSDDDTDGGTMKRSNVDSGTMVDNGTMVYSSGTMVSKDYGTMVENPDYGTMVMSGTVKTDGTSGESAFMDYFRKEKDKETAAAAPPLPAAVDSEESKSVAGQLSKLEKQYKAECAQLKKAYETRKSALNARLL